MAITTRDGYIAALAGAQRKYWAQAARSNAAGIRYSGWTTSTSPIAGAVPTSWAACTSSTQGAIAFTNPTGGNKTYLLGVSMFTPYSKAVEVMIRHGACGGLSGTDTGSQSVNATAPTLGVESDYSNVRWYVEIYSALGSTSRTLTVTYTDQNDASRTTTVTIPASVVATRMLQIEPSGYYIKKVDSVQLNASTGTAGNFGITATTLLSGCNNAVGSALVTPPETGMIEIPDSAAIAFAEGTTIPLTSIDVHGYLILGQG